jgi:hypothetical protein
MAMAMTAARKNEDSVLRDVLMLIHSLVFFLTCHMLTEPLDRSDMLARDASGRLDWLLLGLIFYYVFDSLWLLWERRCWFDWFRLTELSQGDWEMLFHHFVAAWFCWLFFAYAQGVSHFQVFGWNEVPVFFHKLSRFLFRPEDRAFDFPRRRPYQLFYQTLYCVTYFFLAWYIVTCEKNYVFVEPLAPGAWAYHNPVIRLTSFALVMLELWWMMASVRAVVYVWQQWSAEAKPPRSSRREARETVRL